MGADLSAASPSSRPYWVGMFAEFHTCLNLLHGDLPPQCMPLAHQCIASMVYIQHRRAEDIILLLGNCQEFW